MKSSWSERFQIKPGRWVFVPTPEYRNRGNKIKNQIEALWRPPAHQFQFRSGGHLAALYGHRNSIWFAKIDLQNFYGNINRSRVTRGLKSLFPYKQAREMASASVVRSPPDYSCWILPFGFVQSPLIASLCFSRSPVGRYIEKLMNDPLIKLSVYVDDIIISSKNKDALQLTFDDLLRYIKLSKFILNNIKTQKPAQEITVFNIKLSHQSTLIEYERFLSFKRDFNNSSSEKRKNSIYHYVASVNALQAAYL